MFDLGCADTERECTECAVRGCVRIATDNRHTRLRESELRPDHVHDAVFLIAHRKDAQTKLLGIATHNAHLFGGNRIGDRLVDVLRRDVVVLGDEGQIGTTNCASGHA